MYNSQSIAETIKSTAKMKNVSLTSLFSDIGITNNTLHNMNKSMPKADTLAKIADYLNVSVDYLLGRTEYAETYSNGNNSVQAIKNGSVSINTTARDDLLSEFLKVFNSLNFEDKIKIINSAIELNKNK